ncbi:hypothetical protein SAMN02745166_05028 [Prosthecobacter debontii]|uniref:Endonuclease YncB, thermonuclease family n=1 Tax=Prosthecobacter debontii TaxID=48467 RepID=A0A1T4Z478_9BACT|nr:hypothetical protein [Prosthecobacter debontii]SKB08794.1 hypothetical protein SAMN02745166_05028 [Prosthecobacter debontii]
MMKPVLHPRFWLAIVGSFGLSLSIPAQTAPSNTAPDPAPLAVARAGFLRQVLIDSQTLTDQYERALAKVEQELVDVSDYEEARLVQQRRMELKALYPTNDSASAASLTFPMLPSQARFIGSTESRGDLITGWRTGGSGVEWANLRLPTGKYYLELEANLVELPSLPGTLVPGRSAPVESAIFDFFEVSLLQGASENRRSFEVRLSHDDITFEPLKIGPINFTRSPVTLRLITETGYPGNLLRLRNLRLTPATEEAPTITSPAPAGPTLDDLKKSLNDALSSAQKPIIDAYLENLRQLAAATPDLREAIDAEMKRLLKLLENNRGQTASPLRILGNHGGMNGFDDLDGARFVADADNQGDRFTIEHEGKRLTIRLIWVMCAPLDNRDQTTARAFAKHFDLGDADVTALGRAAREFTAGYLEGKALRVLVRPGKNKDGSYNAIVFLPEVGLYQNVLVDQGLAAVTQPREKRGMMENGLFESLQQREEAAKRQKPAPGAWGFSDPAR